MNSTLTFNDIPSYLLSLGERLGNIEHQLTISSGVNNSLVEKPMDIEGAEDFTGLERPTLYALAQRGDIPGHKRGKKWYFYASELNEWIKSGGRNILVEQAEESFLAANANKKGGRR